MLYFVYLAYATLFLQPADPTESTVLAPGSSRDLVFKGGPQPWVLDPSQYFEQGNYLDIIYII